MLAKDESQDTDDAQRDETGNDGNCRRRSGGRLRRRIWSIEPKTIGNGTVPTWCSRRRPCGLYSLLDSHASNYITYCWTKSSVRLFGLFDCVETSGDELVRGVVLVRGDEECAAEAGTGFADRAAEGVFVGTTPTRRGEAGGAFDRF